MMTPRQAVDAIREFLRNPSAQPDAALAEASGVYASACREIAARAARCAEMLAAGRRTTAIYLAEQEPNLCDLYLLCDFAERGQWAVQAGLNASDACPLEAPPGLPEREIHAINDAYAREERIQPLLRRHRRLALARGPIRERLAVLRQLRNADADTAFWLPDIETFEAERRKEIAVEAGDAHARRDGAALAALAAELASPEWLHADAQAALLAQCRQGAGTLHAEAVGVRYAELAQRLEAAHAALAPDEAFGLRERWDALRGESGVEPPPALERRLADAFDWIRGERARRDEDARHAQAVFALEEALESERPAAEVDKLYQAALALGREIPERLRLMVEKRAEGHALVARRSYHQRLLLIGGGVALVLALLGYAAWRMAEARTLSEWKRRLSDTVSGERPEEGRRLLQALETENAAFARHPDIEALRIRLDELEQRERARAADFQALHAKLEAADADTPDLATLDELVRLAKTPAETRAAQLLRARAAERRAVLGRRDAEALAGELAGARLALERLELVSSESASKRLEVLLPLLAQIQRMSSRAQALADADPSLGDTALTLLRRGENLKRDFERKSTLLDGQEKLRQEVERAMRAGSADEYAAALKRYVAEYPETAEAEDFAACLRALPALKNVLAAREATEVFGPLLLPERLPHDDLARILEQAETWGKARGEGLPPALAEWCRGALETGRRYRRFAVDADGRAKLREAVAFMNIRWIAEINRLREKDGYVAYTYDPAPTDGAVTVFKTTRGGDREATERRRVRPEQMLEPLGPAPHSRFVAAALPRLEQSAAIEQWPHCFLDAALECLDVADMDPVIQVSLTRQLVDLARFTADSVAETALADAAKRIDLLYTRYALEANGKTLVRWMATRDELVNSGKKQIANGLERVAATLAEIRRGQLARDTRLAKESPEAAEWIGILLRGDNGSWRFSGRAPAAGHRLSVLTESGRLYPITVENERVAGGEAAYFSGQPVMAVPQAQP